MSADTAAPSSSPLAVLDSLSEVVFQTDTEGRWTYLNPAWADITGFSVEATLGKRFLDYVHPDDRERNERLFAPLVALEKDVCRHEVRYLTHDGGYRWIEVFARLVLEGDEIVGTCGTLNDVTDRHVLQHQLTERMLRDPLTGLPNRTCVVDRLEVALARTARSGRGVGLVHLDLDGLRRLNAALGPEAGDELIAVSGQRLRTAARVADTVAHIGADRFVVVAEDLAGGGELEALAARLQEAVAQQLTLAGEACTPVFSIGMTMAVSADAQPEAMLREAEAAMHRRRGRGVTGGQPVLERAGAIAAAERILLEQGIRRGLDDRQFAVAFQNQVGLGDRRPVGMEALVRWNHPDRGMVAPSGFLPVAEESGLIVRLGCFVLRRACEVACSSAAIGDPRVVSVNLSRRELHWPGLVYYVAEVLRETGLHPRLLCFEVTENALAGDVRATAKVLEALRDLGVGLAIDDFGTGTTSLRHLRELPALDLIKIDRSFVAGVAENDRDRAIVASVVALGSALGVEVVAEGIEREEQAVRLHELGCSMGQGYLFSRPRVI